MDETPMVKYDADKEYLLYFSFYGEAFYRYKKAIRYCIKQNNFKDLDLYKACRYMDDTMTKLGMWETRHLAGTTMWMHLNV